MNLKQQFTFTAVNAPSNEISTNRHYSKELKLYRAKSLRVRNFNPLNLI